MQAQRQKAGKDDKKTLGNAGLKIINPTHVATSPQKVSVPSNVKLYPTDEEIERFQA